ncbi:hypothetical protein CISG_08824 [Coccidioides immitis RMSCC 3703]|uniref:Uncharacterized protein n=2 Tax=Coccidioides immitis TaxID=5501 RepID=A0A0J8RAM8_COCIT|nr:hypothetical protein CIRG_02408 [Coccidioides immitis RMSCC 2394]KMU80928.1 hypothetical protein CISG_08824 [Coccidioides immitis RMSCC 3703]
MDEESQSSIIHILATHMTILIGNLLRRSVFRVRYEVSSRILLWRIGTTFETCALRCASLGFEDRNAMGTRTCTRRGRSDLVYRGAYGRIRFKSTFSSFRDIITKRKLRQELAEVFGWLRRECRQPIVNRPELIDDIETRQHLCNARILPREHTGPRTRQKCPTTFADLHRRRTKTNLSKDPTPLRKDRHTSHILTGKPQGQSGQWSSAF